MARSLRSLTTALPPLARPQRQGRDAPWFARCARSRATRLGVEQIGAAGESRQRERALLLDPIAQAYGVNVFAVDLNRIGSVQCGPQFADRSYGRDHVRGGVDAALQDQCVPDAAH